MARTTQVPSRDLGLSIGLILSRYFLRTDHLHYGYWTENLPIDTAHLHEAQNRYLDLLVSSLPENLHTILDVGCGAGTLAMRLKTMGYEVECISPSPLLTQRARELLGSSQTIHECRFEDFETDKRYDAVIFSESFQYINLEKALQKSFRLLNEGGVLLISDFFSRTENDPSPMGGGHDILRFQEEIKHYSFVSLQERDITNETAPTLDLAEDLIAKVVVPLKDVLSNHLRLHHPTINRALRWIYRKKIVKLRTKYFSGTRNAKCFLKHKTYRLLVFKKISETLKSRTSAV